MVRRPITAFLASSTTIERKQSILNDSSDSKAFVGIFVGCTRLRSSYFSSSFQLVLVDTRHLLAHHWRFHRSVWLQDAHRAAWWPHGLGRMLLLQ